MFGFTNLTGLGFPGKRNRGPKTVENPALFKDEGKDTEEDKATGGRVELLLPIVNGCLSSGLTKELNLVLVGSKSLKSISSSSPFISSGCSGHIPPPVLAQAVLNF